MLPEYQTWGIASFRVQDIPQSITHRDSQQTFDIQVEHTPKDSDYPHSDIFCYLQGDRYTNRENSKFRFIAKKLQLHLYQKNAIKINKLPD